MSNDLLDQSGLTPALAELQARATVADASAQISIPLSGLWDELAAGVAAAVTSFIAGDRCYLVLRISTHRASDWPKLRNFELLKQGLLGPSQKAVAIDNGFSASLVAAGAAEALRWMGFNCSATRAPLMIIMAAHARFGTPLYGRESPLACSLGICRVISTPLPDVTSINRLSDAERSIVRLLFERRSNAEIARLRETTERTVANQLASLLQKLRAANRSDAISQLIVASTAGASQFPSLRPAQSWPREEKKFASG